MASSAASVVAVALTTVAVLPLPATQGAADPARGTDMPIVREAHFVVNARIRPLLFWMGRDDVGGAQMTWRAAGGDTRRAIELLIGSDPARTPRQINRWGFIAEQVRGTSGEVVGVMKGSSDETFDEARANVGQDEAGSLMRAVRTTIDGNRAVTHVSSFVAPPSVTYHQLDAVLAMWPAGSNVTRSFDLPPGTEKGFLLAMTRLTARSAEACRSGARTVPSATLSYLYAQTVYDLTLASCEYKPRLQTGNGTWTDIVDGRFQVRSRRTGEVTTFEVSYGPSRDWWQVPVRAVFRPRWWMEVELLLD